MPSDRPRDKPFGPVIAERRLHVRNAPRRVVTVSLGRPRKTKGHDDWQCPFRIAGTDLKLVEYGYGVDAFQALMNALEGIRHFLDRSETPLAWTGVADDHTGFQRLIPLFPDFAGMRRLEGLVDREVQRLTRALKWRHQARVRRRSRST